MLRFALNHIHKGIAIHTPSKNNQSTVYMYIVTVMNSNDEIEALSSKICHTISFSFFIFSQK